MTRLSLSGAPLRMSAYVAVLAAAFGGAFAVGASAGPVGVRSGAAVQDSHGDVGAARREPAGRPEVRVGAEFPTSGSYRLYLDAQVGGSWRTAEFTKEIL